MCTYVTSQLFLRRRFSQPPRAHHIPPAHSFSFLRSLSADFGSASFVFGSVFSYLKRGGKDVGITQKRLHSRVESWCVEWFLTALNSDPFEVYLPTGQLSEIPHTSFPRLVGQIKGFTWIWCPPCVQNNNGDVLGVEGKKRAQATESGEVFCCYMERLMLIPVSVEAIPSLRDCLEMSYSGPMHSFFGFCEI